MAKTFELDWHNDDCNVLRAQEYFEVVWKQEQTACQICRGALPYTINILLQF